jgi:hypothetical protein
LFAFVFVAHKCSGMAFYYGTIVIKECYRSVY